MGTGGETDERHEPPGADGMDPGRVFALSDGVFAIASTLLALDLRVPENLAPGQLPAALVALTPELRGFAISFLVIGLLWLGHHATFRSFRRFSRPVAALNILLLGLVVMLPFPSSVLTDYSDRPVAVMLYAATVAAILLLQVAMLFVGRRRGELEPRLSKPAIFLPAASTAAVFLVSLPIALVDPAAAMYFWLVLIPLHYLVDRLAGIRE
jgi:uncharacterized membrane protein